MEVAILSKDGLFYSRMYGEDNAIKVHVLENLEIRVADIFADSWVKVEGDV